MIYIIVKTVDGLYVIYAIMIPLIFNKLHPYLMSPNIHFIKPMNTDK